MGKIVVLASCLVLLAGCRHDEARRPDDRRTVVHYTIVPQVPDDHEHFDETLYEGRRKPRQAVVVESHPGSARVALEYGNDPCPSQLGDGSGDHDAYVQGTRLVVLLHRLPQPDVPNFGCTGEGKLATLSVRLPDGVDKVTEAELVVSDT